MATETRISEEAYERLALAEPDRKWELHDGRLEDKPGMTWEHSILTVFLGYLLLRQLDRTQYEVLAEVRVRGSTRTISIPDLVVAPVAFGVELRGKPGTLVILSDPLPLLIEIWSSSTGRYDVAAKIPEYQRRGDEEIWLVHPYERTLTSWHRQPDGSYETTVHREGVVKARALPGVAVDLSELFTV